MKKTLALLLCAALVFAIGCVPVLAAGDEEIWGHYILTDMTGMDGDFAAVTGGSEASGEISDYLALMAALGMTATLDISEDGAATLDLFGEIEELTFDFDAGTATAGDVVIPYTFEDGVLVLSDDEGDISFTFTKGEGSAQKGVGAFEYYVLENLTDDKGEPIALPEAPTTILLYPAGDGTMTTDGETVELQFALDDQAVSIDGAPASFTMVKDMLAITDEAGVTMLFRRSDPGFAGPYIATSLITEDEGDLTETLGMMSRLGMAPTLVIDEDGMGVMEIVDETTELLFDFDSMIVRVEDEEMPFTYENGTITLEQDGNVMTFGRVMPRTVKEGWQKDGDAWRYVTESGAWAADQWLQIEDEWYFFDADGYAVQNGWAKDGDAWSWLDEDGHPVRNDYAETDEGRIWFDEDGHAADAPQ